MLDAENPDSTESRTDTDTTAPSEAVAAGTAVGSPTEAGEPAKKVTKRAPAKKAAKKAPAKRATKKAAADPDAPQAAVNDSDTGKADAVTKPKKKAAAKAPVKLTSADVPEALFQAPEAASVPVEDKPVKKAATRKRVAKKDAESVQEDLTATGTASGEDTEDSRKPAKKSSRQPARKKAVVAGSDAPAEQSDADSSNQPGSNETSDSEEKSEQDTGSEPQTDTSSESESDPDTDDESGDGSARRRPRRRGGRRRRGRGGNGDHGDHGDDSADGSHDHADDDSNGDGRGSARDKKSTGAEDDSEDTNDESGEGGSRRRRQRQRKPRNLEDEITSVQGSTRLEAKKQRRREGREAGRRRAPIVSEAEFLARRESVDRVMVVRQKEDLTQIGVLEDNVLVEHYVSRQSQTSLIGNVYLGRVQNVLPSMEAAFVDIGKGRNAVIYAGEVNWSAVGHKDGQPRKIESVLSSGQTILVQVTKDPIGHKGARLSGQVSLPGRFLVYVPDGNTSGISRKLPDTERHRLKTLLKQIVPDSAGVIVRTAAEGASEAELTQDVERLTARWNDIEAKVKVGKSPELLYGEPDLTLKVVRDLFTEDFTKLVIQGDDAWDLVEGYVSHVAPDLNERLERFEPDESGKDVFAAYRVNEQIAKGLDRKVWLPSGGSLIIDRTEAMTVVDVNTGKFTGSGGNLEETVTKNNLEAAEEMVRQLRLRDIGGIIVIDFIDMVLESNRDLVLRRLVECLGRDRTRHQVAEVTSLGLVQMTRKRIGTGLVESFSEDCTHCKGRGVVIHDHPIESDHQSADDEPRRGRGRGGNQGNSQGGAGNGGGRGRGRGAGNSTPQSGNDQNQTSGPPKPPSPADLAGTKPKPVEEEAPDAPAVQESPSAPSAQPADERNDGGRGEQADSVEVPPTPPAPTVVSTTRRRRAATRPAGLASPASEPVEEQATAVQESPSADSGQPADERSDSDQGEQADSVEVPPTPPAPTVVSTTRRRRTATRPAGPPVPAASAPPEPESAADGTPDPAPGAAEDTDAANVLHVPVKRKGTRKR